MSGLVLSQLGAPLIASLDGSARPVVGNIRAPRAGVRGSSRRARTNAGQAHVVTGAQRILIYNVKQLRDSFAMRDDFDFEAFMGQWFVPNPDRGQALPERSARLIIGGNYLIHPNRRVEAHLKLRNDAGKVESRTLVGEVGRADEFTIRLELDGGVREVFEVVDPATLRRVSSNIGTVEDELSLVLQKRYETAAAKPVAPSILFNTMPKSGSIFISRWLAMGLNLHETKVAVCLFPDDLIIREKYDRFITGGKICQQHLPARDLNLRFIANRDPRIIVHLRDPRQATVSWTHHLDNFYEKQESVPACKLGLEAVMPPLPSDYFARPFDARLDYQIHTHLPQLIEWTQGWVSAAQSAAYGLKVLFTSFEGFKRDPDNVISSILGHYSISKEAFDWSKRPAATSETHFRKGEVDEWREVFTREQVKYASSLLSDRLVKEFGWSA